MNERHTTFPSAPEAFFLVFCLWAVNYLVSIILLDARKWLGLDDAYSLGDIALVLANGIIFTALMHWKNLSYRDLFHASRSQTAATVVVVVPLVLLAAPLMILVMGLLQSLLLSAFPMNTGLEGQFKEMLSARLPQIIMVCILAPVLEEMLFRGIILRSFLQQYERSYAILGSAVIFGFAHANMYQLVGATAFGLAAGWLYERTRSLIPGIALHAAVNTSTMLISSSDTVAAVISEPATLLLLLLAAVPACFMLRRCLEAPVR